MTTQAYAIAHITTIDMSLRYLLQNQLNSLNEAGYDVVGISSMGPDVSAIKAAGIRHIPIRMTRRLTPLADLFTLWQLYWVMRRESFTIVHTHNPKPGLLGQLAARMADVPIVVNTLHGFYFHDHMSLMQRRFYITLEKIAARCSDLILSQNKEDMQTLIREGICGPEKIKHLGNGIDLRRFDPHKFSDEIVRAKKESLGISSNAPVIGFVGRLAAKRKGFLDFLRAGQKVLVTCPNARFLIIGQADLGKPDAVDPKVASAYGLEDACLFLGYRPNEELPLLYHIMNILVLPSLFEGIPRAVMEALAMHVPAIVTNVKGNREVVDHEQNGLFVPLGDVSALAEAILRLLTNQDEARQMGERGRQLALERFDERLVFEKVKATYVELLHQKGLLFEEPQCRP